MAGSLFDYIVCLGNEYELGITVVCGALGCFWVWVITVRSIYLFCESLNPWEAGFDIY